MNKEINWDCLKNDIPFGQTVGVVVGKAVGGIAYGVRHPIIGASQLAGSAEGFFQGLKLGLEVTAANFEKAKIRGSVNKLTRASQKLGEEETKILQNMFDMDGKKKSILERFRNLPEDIRNEILGDVQLTPASAQ